MTQPLLEKIVCDFDVDAPVWTTFDFENFSRHKRLWDYQQNALQCAMKALWKFYDDYRNFSPDEDSDKANTFRKGKLFTCYEDNGLTDQFQPCRICRQRLRQTYFDSQTTNSCLQRQRRFQQRRKAKDCFAIAFDAHGYHKTKRKSSRF
jgi:hypothetical protein